MTLVLAWLFVVFAAYGLSGAGVIRRLPLLGGVLFLISALYTVRGLSIIGQVGQYLSMPGSPPLRVVLYSLIALVAGLCYLGGTLQGYPGPGPPSFLLVRLIATQGEVDEKTDRGDASQAEDDPQSS